MNFNLLKSIFHSDVCHFIFGHEFHLMHQKSKTEKIKPILSFLVNKVLKKLIHLDLTSSISFYNYTNLKKS